MPLRLEALVDILNPQPAAAEVFHGVLDWIDRCDRASQTQQPPSPAAGADGAPLFPEHEWWLKELERRRPAEGDVNMEDEAPYDDDALTRKPEDALWHSNGSGSRFSGGESDGSLPAGPRMKVASKPLRAPARKKRSGSAMQGESSSVGSDPLAQPVLRQRMRGKQSPVPPVSAVTAERKAAALKEGLPGRAAEEVLVLGRSSLGAAPGWMRRSAKADDGTVQVQDDDEGMGHAPPHLQTRAEAVAAMWQRFRRDS